MASLSECFTGLQGGGVFAVTPVLKEHRDMKWLPSQASDSKEFQVVVRFTGEHVGARIVELDGFVALVGAATQIPFANEARGVINVAYHWKPLADARFGWKGDLDRCKAKDEIIQLYSQAEGKTIEIPGGGKIVVEIIPNITMIAEARNFRLA